MNVTLYLYDHYSSEREATRVITLPAGLSPFIGMMIHQADDNDFVVSDIEVSIDHPQEVILHLDIAHVDGDPTENVYDIVFDFCAKNPEWKINDWRKK